MNVHKTAPIPPMPYPFLSYRYFLFPFQMGKETKNESLDLCLSYFGSFLFLLPLIIWIPSLTYSSCISLSSHATLSFQSLLLSPHFCSTSATVAHTICVWLGYNALRLCLLCQFPLHFFFPPTTLHCFSVCHIFFNAFQTGKSLPVQFGLTIKQLNSVCMGREGRGGKKVRWGGGKKSDKVTHTGSSLRSGWKGLRVFGKNKWDQRCGVN